MLKRLAIVLWWGGALALVSAVLAFADQLHADRVCSASRAIISAAEPAVSKLREASAVPTLDAMLAQRASGANIAEFDRLTDQVIADSTYGASHPEYVTARAGLISCEVSTMQLAIVLGPLGLVCLVACFVLSGSLWLPPRQTTEPADQ